MLTMGLSRTLSLAGICAVVTCLAIASIAGLFRLIGIDTEAIQAEVLPVFLDLVRYSALACVTAESLSLVIREWGFARQAQIVLENRLILADDEDSDDSDDSSNLN